MSDQVAVWLGAIASSLMILTTLFAWIRWARKRSLKSLEAVVRSIAAQTQQLVPNGGSSVKDAVDAIRRDVASIAGTVKAVQSTVNAQGDAIHNVSARVDDLAVHIGAPAAPARPAAQEGVSAHAAPGA
jgi:hypothetical protein